MISLAAHFLRGSYPPLVTPFRDGAVDYDAFAALVEYQVREGSHGIVVTGTSGEPSTLTLDERSELFNAVGNVAPRKVAELYELTAAGNLAAARRLHFELFELNQAVFFDTNLIPIKYMMKRLGLLQTNEHRLPMVPATADLEKRLEGVLRRAGLI